MENNVILSFINENGFTKTSFVTLEQYNELVKSGNVILSRENVDDKIRVVYYDTMDFTETATVTQEDYNRLIADGCVIVSEEPVGDNLIRIVFYDPTDITESEQVGIGSGRK